MTRVLAFLASVLFAVASAQAQDFPTRPVRFIVPVGPGSGGDTVTRFVAERAQALLGQPAIVDNRPGGDSVIASQNMLSSPADGYSVLLITPSITIINPLTNSAIPYKPQDIRPLAGAARALGALVVGADSKFKTLDQLLAAARRQPGGVSMAEYGPNYRLGEQALQKVAGVEFNTISYKGASQLMTDLIGGSTDAALVDAGGALPLIRAGKLRALAVSGKQRHPDLPAVPTVAESGFPDYEHSIWIGFGVSAKTPDAIARKLESVLTQVVAQPEFAAFAARNGSMEVMPVSGAQLKSLIESDTRRFGEIYQSLR